MSRTPTRRLRGSGHYGRVWVNRVTFCRERVRPLYPHKRRKSGHSGRSALGQERTSENLADCHFFQNGFAISPSTSAEKPRSLRWSCEYDASSSRER